MRLSIINSALSTYFARPRSHFPLTTLNGQLYRGLTLCGRFLSGLINPRFAPARVGHWKVYTLSFLLQNDEQGQSQVPWEHLSKTSILSLFSTFSYCRPPPPPLLIFTFLLLVGVQTCWLIFADRLSKQKLLTSSCSVKSETLTYFFALINNWWAHFISKVVTYLHF